LRSWTPVTPADLAARLVSRLIERPGVLRVAVDGPPCAEPGALAESLVAPLHAAGRPALHVRAVEFWHDASLRFEHGREDVETYRRWLDADALRRETLEPAGRGAPVLPSLRDPVSNRSTRAPARELEPGTVLLVSGALLLGRGLPFERVVHLAVSPAARRRRTPAADAWTLPAFDAYDAEVDPATCADTVIKLDDPRHPALAHRR
jgi:hypothetical protein